MTKAELSNMYKDFLLDEGYRPEIDGDGDVVFKSEGRVYVILIQEEDQVFFRLIFPNFWSIENELEREKVFKAASLTTGSIKVAKIFPSGDNVSAAVECFYSSPDHFKGVFNRTMTALRSAVDTFQIKMNE